MKLFFIFVFSTLYLAESAFGTSIFRPLCPLNESYQACSDGCEYTCENYATAGACAGVCNPDLAGCYCNPGFVRNADRDCVSYDDCTREPVITVVEPQPPYCNGPNETFIACGTLCPLTCATKNRVYKCKAGCQPGCFCSKGYLRNSRNKCVPIAKCD